MVKKSSKSKGETRTSFMFPLLHGDVENAVSADVRSTWFCDSDSDIGALRRDSTHVMGKFRCTNKACDMYGWGSRKVAILIRGYAGNGYNAVVFNQRCKACDRLGTFTLDEDSYVDRVAYRVRKWAGVKMDPPLHKPKEGKPHETKFCEGCKIGVCQQG